MTKILDVPSSGSINFRTYSHNKGGQYIRNRRTPTNPNSTKQQQIRSILAGLSSQWSTLTSVQQQAWVDWASVNTVVDTLGQSIQLSGQQAFIMLNSRLLQGGATANTSPPAGTGPSPLLTLTVTATAPSTISAAFTTTPAAAGDKVMLWMTLPASVGRNPNLNQARVAGYGAAATVSPLAITSPYPAVAGQASNFFAAVMDSAGRISPPIRYRATWA